MPTRSWLTLPRDGSVLVSGEPRLRRPEVRLEETEAVSGGVDRKEAGRHVPPPVPGRERQGARSALQAEGGRSAVARRSDSFDRDRQLRRSTSWPHDVRRLLPSLGGASGLGTDDRGANGPSPAEGDVRLGADGGASCLTPGNLGESDGVRRVCAD